MLPCLLFSQNYIDSSFQSTPLSIKDPISSLRMSGYFRYLGYVIFKRYMLWILKIIIQAYIHNQQLLALVQDIIEPMLMLSISGKSKKNLTFGTDLI